MVKGELRLSTDTQRCGERAAGQVTLHFKKPVRLFKLRVVFVGKELTRWSEGSGQSQRHYYSQRTFTNVFLDIMESDQGEEECHFEYPFDFPLPNNLLPSYRFHEGKIYYSFRALGIWKKVSKSEKNTEKSSKKIQKKLEKDNFKRFHKTPFTILPTPANPMYDPLTDFLIAEKKMSNIFGQNQGFIQIRGKVDKFTYRPGESLDVIVYIKNQSNKKIDSLKVKARHHLDFWGSGTHRRHTRTLVKDKLVLSLKGEKDAKEELEFQMNVKLPESVFESFKGQYIISSYHMTVQIDIPWASDLYLRIPFVV